MLQVHPPGQCAPGQLSQPSHIWPPLHRWGSLLLLLMLNMLMLVLGQGWCWCWCFDRVDADPVLEHQVLPRPHHGLLLPLPQPHHWVHKVQLNVNSHQSKNDEKIFSGSLIATSPLFSHSPINCGSPKKTLWVRIIWSSLWGSSASASS